MHVLYVTGLGDSGKLGQRCVVALWRLFGVTPHFFASCWGNTQESFETKLDRLLRLIDRYAEEDKPVGLVGVSAGSSLALHAFAARRNQVSGVVCISGKIHHPEGMRSRVMEHNPSFRDSLHKLPRTLSMLSQEDRARIRTVYSDGDTVVPMEDSMIQNTEMELVGHRNHGLTISQQITLGAWRNLQFLRQLPRK